METGVCRKAGNPGEKGDCPLLSDFHLDKRPAVRNDTPCRGRRATGGSRNPIRETGNAVTGGGERAVIVDPRDLKGHNETTEKVKELLALQNSILDALPIAVMAMEERRIILANHAVEDVFGWKPEELIGKSTRVLYRSEEDHDRIARTVYTALKRQRTYKLEFPCRRKGGKNIDCLVSVARIGDSLQDRRIIATYEDITERKRTELALEESERTLRALLRTYRK